MFDSETDGPIIIDTGIMENNSKKYFSIYLFILFDDKVL